LTLPGDLATSNKGFVDKWNRSKQSKEVEKYGRVHNDLFNFQQMLAMCLKLHIKFTKSKKGFYLLNPKNDTKDAFRLIDAILYNKRVKLFPHNPTGIHELSGQGSRAIQLGMSGTFQLKCDETR
jgi:hypothetical protein